MSSAEEMGAGQAKKSGTSKDGEIASFISRVLPWPRDGDPGVVNLHWTSPKGPGMRGRPYTNVAHFLSMAAWGSKHADSIKDIYFCLSLQSAVGETINGHARAHRSQQNALTLKAIWLDIDVKPDKGYVKLSEALDALAKFLNDAKLVRPTAIVFSGSGLHVYWISNKPLTVIEWRPYAEGLKAAVIKYGLKCDTGLTTDAARVLRVPGTLNYKTTPPKPVELRLLEKLDCDFSAQLAHLASSTSQNEMAENVAGTYGHDDTPLDYANLFRDSGCPFFRDAWTAGGKEHSQGLWMLTVLMTTFLKDGHKLAHRLSKDHPGYKYEETEAMWERKTHDRKELRLGWPSCKAIQSEGCKLCATCVHLLKNKSPLHLALPQQAPSSPLQPSFVDPYAEFAGPAFPMDVLPPTLRKFVDAEYRAMGADPSAIAMAVLTAVAGAIHAETVMRVGEGWWERPILWTALVGQPSTKKSPIIDKARKPLSGIDNERNKRWRQEHAIWQQQNKK